MDGGGEPWRRHELHLVALAVKGGAEIFETAAMTQESHLVFRLGKLDEADFCCPLEKLPAGTDLQINVGWHRPDGLAAE